MMKIKATAFQEGSEVIRAVHKWNELLGEF